MRHRNFACRVGWHTYRPARTEDNQVYKRCIRCGKDQDGTPTVGDVAGRGAAFGQPSF